MIDRIATGSSTSMIRRAARRRIDRRPHMPDRSPGRATVAEAALRVALVATLASLGAAAPATARPDPTGDPGAAGTRGTAAVQQAPPRCDDVEGFHLLDFWVGGWTVEDPAGARLGTNEIEKVLNGCALVERWRGAGGGEGMSLFTYDHLADTWKQVWVTGLATAPGGLKEKELVEVLPGGGVRFLGTVRLPGGDSYLDRTTLTPEGDGTVRQVIETSSDDGASWVERFVGVYRPAR